MSLSFFSVSQSQTSTRAAVTGQTSLSSDSGDVAACASIGALTLGYHLHAGVTIHIFHTVIFIYH